MKLIMKEGMSRIEAVNPYPSLDWWVDSFIDGLKFFGYREEAIREALTRIGDEG